MTVNYLILLVVMIKTRLLFHRLSCFGALELQGRIGVPVVVKLILPARGNLIGAVDTISIDVVHQVYSRTLSLCLILNI